MPKAICVAIVFGLTACDLDTRLDAGTVGDSNLVECTYLLPSATEFAQNNAIGLSNCTNENECMMAQPDFSCENNTRWNICDIIINRSKVDQFYGAIEANKASFCSTTANCKSGIFETPCECFTMYCRDGGCQCDPL